MALPSGTASARTTSGLLRHTVLPDLRCSPCRIGLIPTGSELVAHGSRPAAGQVVESNTVMAEAMTAALGATCTRYPVVKDDPAEIKKSLQRAVPRMIVVIISAGSSAGTKDYHCRCDCRTRGGARPRRRIGSSRQAGHYRTDR